MKKRRVLVLANDSLLISGLLSLLREHPGIEVVTAMGGTSELHHHTGARAPHAVVMESEQGDAAAGADITRFLRENPRSTLVALSVDQPDMEVFRARRVRGATLEGLLRILDGAQRKARRAVAGTVDT